MARHEIHSLLWLALFVAVYLGAADQAVGEAPQRAVRAAEEVAGVVAEPPVPLLPAVPDEAAHLVQARRVPGLGEELGGGERRVRLDVPEDGRIRHRLPRLIARQDRREIEPESVHVHHLDPVPEAVHDHPADDGVVGVERVSTAGVVGVASAVVLQDIVRRVVQAPEAQRRPMVIALRGVIEHDVEDHLEARPVQRLHHVTELVDRTQRISTRAVRLVGREERDRLVAPVVDPVRRALGVELEHRQQLHGRHPEVAEIRDLLDQAGVGAARLLSDPRARMAREPAHVRLVHDCARGRPAQRRVPFPLVRVRVHHHALHRRGGVVTVLGSRSAPVAVRHDHAAPVRVEEHLLGVESQPARRVGRTLHAIAVDLAGAQARHEHVPVVVRAVDGGIDADCPGGPRVVDAVEEQQLHAGGVPGEYTENHPLLGRRGAEGGTRAFAGPGGRGRHPQCGHRAVLGVASTRATSFGGGSASTMAASLPSSRTCSAVVVANRCSIRAMMPVHPVW